MRTIILVLTIVLGISAYAQDFKFGRVSKEELTEKENPNDPNANATVLYKNEAIFFKYVEGKGFRQSRQVHERIKIYNKEGFDWATKKVRLFNRSNSQSENLYALKGYTYNLVNGKVEEDKLKKDGQFDEEVNKYWKISSFTMPNIQEGCVIEYQYEINSPFMGIDDVDFQYTIPINKFELVIKTPEYFIYNRLINPKATYQPRLNDSKSSNSINYTTKQRAGGFSGPATTTFTSEKIEYLDNVIEANETNIPALVEEPMVDNLNNYKAKLILEITATKFPNEIMEYYSSSWEDVTKSIYQDSDFGFQLERNNYYKDELSSVLGNETNELKKASAVFNFVKSKVSWNGFYGYSSEIGVRKAYNEGTGNAADINLMLTSMLRFAGVKANPVLVSTKSNGIPIFPTVQGFNYVVCLVEGENFVGLLDATDPMSSMNLLPERALNWQGRLIKEDGSSNWVNMMSQISADETVYLNASIDSDNSISGNVRNTLANHHALNFRHEYGNISPDQMTQIIEKNEGDLIVEELDIKNVKNLSKPIAMSFKYKSSDVLEEVGDKIIFSPLMFLKEQENTFLQETRNYPIDYKFPQSKKYVVNIMLPEGYSIETLPESEKYQFKDGLGEYTYLIESRGNNIQLVVRQNLNSSVISTTDYPFYKQFYNSIFTKQSEPIVLKRI